MFTSNIQFTFILQCSFKSEPVNIIVWINSSHFQDKQSGYNDNDITFQEGFNFIVFQEELWSFCNSLFSDFYAAFLRWTVNASRDTVPC